MQRQKTIAKWLAIILLLTSIIACYIAFSTIIKNKNASAPDIADADADNIGGNISGDYEYPELPEPVYSTFPRSADVVDGISVSHIGGEDNDILLDTLYASGKRYIFFYSASTQYDVNECGIHIAAFQNGNLISTTKIGEVDESFVASSIVENGLLVITKNVAQTKLRLLNSNLEVICENVCQLYSDYKLYVTSSGVRMYTTDSRFIYANTISKSLDVTRSNYVHPVVGGEIIYLAGLNSYDTLFVQTAQGIAYFTYSLNDGFNCVGEQINCRLLQVLPHSVNGAPAFAILAKCDDGIMIANIDATLKQSASYTFKGAKTAVAMLSDNDNICVIADETKCIFCSHLDLQQSSSITFTDATDNITYSVIDGETDYFMIAQDNTYYIVKMENDALTTKLKVSGKSVKVVRDLVQGKSELSVLFDGTVNNSFAYMCFGAYDVFYLTRFA